MLLMICLSYLTTRRGRQQGCHRETQTAKHVAVFIRLTQHINLFLKTSGVFLATTHAAATHRILSTEVAFPVTKHSCIMGDQSHGRAYLGRGFMPQLDIRVHMNN
jgi:hypothetical protein